MTSRRRIITSVLIVDAIIVAIVIAWLMNRSPAEPIGPVTVPVSTEPAETQPVTVEPVAAVEDTSGLPTIAAEQIERHGTYRGQPFWLRLAPSSPEFAGNRKLEVVFTPTAPSEVDGSLLHDSPILIVDAHLRLIQWDNRDGATGVLRQASPDSYLVVREKKNVENDQVQLLRRTLTVPLGWPLELAPLFALLVEGDAWSMPVYDFWGPRVTETLTATRTGDTIDIAGTTLQRSAQALTGGDLDVVLSTP